MLMASVITLTQESLELAEFVCRSGAIILHLDMEVSTEKTYLMLQLMRLQGYLCLLSDLSSSHEVICRSKSSVDGVEGLFRIKLARYRPVLLM